MLRKEYGGCFLFWSVYGSAAWSAYLSCVFCRPARIPFETFIRKYKKRRRVIRHDVSAQSKTDRMCGSGNTVPAQSVRYYRPHLRQGSLQVPHPSFLSLGHPSAAGAAEKKQDDQDPDPGHVVGIKQIAKAAHNGTSMIRLWSAVGAVHLPYTLLYHSMRGVRRCYKIFCQTIPCMHAPLRAHTVSAARIAARKEDRNRIWL